MIIIYDFDGTLTTFSKPQYDVLKQCGYDDEKLMNRINYDIESKKSKSIYDSYYKIFLEILNENNIKVTRQNICIGAKNVKFNKGVISFFEEMQTSKTGIKHYIVTSGLQEYVEETIIAKYVNGIYGVTFKENDGVFEEVDYVLSDIRKVDIIKKIQEENPKEKNILYLGDGTTDIYAFEYVHNIGGQSIFIKLNEKSENKYQKIAKNNIIDKCFDADFSKDSELYNFIMSYK